METKLTVLAVDPGTNRSAIVSYGIDLAANTLGKLNAFDIQANDKLVADLKIFRLIPNCQLVIENPASYGMPVGAEIFDTCIWIGRFIQVWPFETKLIGRKEVVNEICEDSRGRDKNVRSALIELWGGKDQAIGRKRNPGPLYGVTADVWAALAVAVAWGERRRREFRGLQSHKTLGNLDAGGQL